VFSEGDRPVNLFTRIAAFVILPPRIYRKSSINSDPAKYSQAFEFFRYVIVGGAAFLIDFFVLFVSKKYLFSFLETTKGILFATAAGFLSGLIFNFIFSILFVFKNTNENAKRHKILSFVMFAVIGIAGLGITEFCMYIGILIFGQNYYLFVKIITAGIVLIWNYCARKKIIFKKQGIQK
jgi:putative flippase GtrA